MFLAASNVVGAKVTLVVMGTTQGNQLRPPTSTSNRSSWTIASILTLPFRVVQWTLQMSLLFCQSFLNPLLPAFLLPDNDDNARRRDGQHED